MADDDDCVELPPDFNYHVIQGHAPKIFYWLWGISGAALIVVIALIVPAIRRIRAKGVEVRSKADDILLSPSYRFVLLIVAFPLVLCVSKFIVLLSPFTIYAMEFISHGYEGICLYCFARLLLLFLGTHKIAIETLENADPIKFWAVIPFGCCFRPCCKAQKFTKKDFRIIYAMIIQYTILAPCFSFFELITSIEGSGALVRLIRILNLLSSFVCIYALFALLKVSANVLHSFRPHGKFFTIKGAVLLVVLIDIVIQYTHVKGKKEDRYTSEVMIDAYSAFATLLVIAPLSFAFTKYFDVTDCESARIIPFEKRKDVLIASLRSQSSIKFEIATNTSKENALESPKETTN